MTKIFLLGLFFILIWVSFVSSECTDSDGGKDYSEKGETKDEFNTAEDICSYFSDENRLVVTEYFCEEDRIDSKYYDCEGLCEAGACRSLKDYEKEQKYHCTETDNGLNFYEKGKNWGWINNFDYARFKYDKCREFEIDKDVLDEVICNEDGSIATKSYKCPNGCEDGACIGKPNEEEEKVMAGEIISCEEKGYSCMDISCPSDMEVSWLYSCESTGRPTPCCKFKSGFVPATNNDYFQISNFSNVNSKYLTLNKIDPTGDTRWEFKPDASTFTKDLQEYIKESIKKSYIEGEKVSYISRYDVGVEKIDVIIMKIDSEKISLDDFLNYLSGDNLRKNYIDGCTETPEKPLFTEVKQLNGVSNGWEGKRSHYLFYLNNSDCPHIKSHEFRFWMSNDKIIWTDTVLSGNLPELGGEYYYTGYTFTGEYSYEYPSTIYPLVELACTKEGRRNKGNYCRSIGTHYVSQKELGLHCQKDYECENNFCDYGKCTKAGFFRKILNWFIHTF